MSGAPGKSKTSLNLSPEDSNHSVSRQWSSSLQAAGGVSEAQRIRAMAMPCQSHAAVPTKKRKLFVVLAVLSLQGTGGGGMDGPEARK